MSASSEVLSKGEQHGDKALVGPLGAFVHQFLTSDYVVYTSATKVLANHVKVFAQIVFVSLS